MKQYISSLRAYIYRDYFIFYYINYDRSNGGSGVFIGGGGSGVAIVAAGGH